ncbi:MAG: CBS domain-containing protein [Desulfobulbaceae bacterium]
MKVKDIMVPITEHLGPEDSLRQAVLTMRSAKRWHGQGVKGMVVLDGEGRLAGILSIKDILRSTIPVYLDPKISRFSWDGMLEEMARQVACRLVKDFMSREVITIDAEASLMACTDLLIEKNLQRLPVVNPEGKVVGIVYIRDIYNVISQIFVDQPECPL